MCFAAIGLATASCGEEEAAERRPGPALAERSAAAAIDRSAGPRGTIVPLDPEAAWLVVVLEAADRIVAIGEEAGYPPSLTMLPRVDHDGALALRPDWLILPGTGAPNLAIDDPGGAAPRRVEFEAHDLEDVFAWTRGPGREIFGRARTASFEWSVSRPLALIAAESDPFHRPRVVAIVSARPMRLAGGHSFATDLIEIAGGQSATHGGEERWLPASGDRIRSLAPDLVVVMLTEADDETLADVLEVVPAGIPSIVFREPVGRFWAVEEPARVARALRRAMLEALPRFRVEADPAGP